MAQEATTSKMHQLLAVEPTRQAAAKAQLAEVTATFAKKPNLFEGQQRTLSMFDTSPEKATEVAAIQDKEKISQSVAYTVDQNLNYMAGLVGSWIDVLYRKELTNQTARADVVIDGKVIIKDAPATFLLAMENIIGTQLKDPYNAIPTLSPGIDWEKADSLGKFIFKSPKVKTIKTEKVSEFIKHQQTSDKHPDTFTEKFTDKNVGVYESQKFSGMMQVVDKAAVIARWQRLLEAVKDARQRANQAEVVMGNCAMNIFAFIHGDFHDENQVKAATAGA